MQEQERQQAGLELHSEVSVQSTDGQLSVPLSQQQGRAHYQINHSIFFFPLRKSWQNAVLHPCSPFTDSDPVQASQSSVPLTWVAWSLRTASCLGGTLEAEYIKRIS